MRLVLNGLAPFNLARRLPCMDELVLRVDARGSMDFGGLATFV